MELRIVRAITPIVEELPIVDYKTTINGITYSQSYKT